jgi:hypothetical protein
VNTLDKINAKLNDWDKNYAGRELHQAVAALRRALEVEHEMFYITPRMRSLRWAKAKRDIAQILEGK